MKLTHKGRERHLRIDHRRRWEMYRVTARHWAGYFGRRIWKLHEGDEIEFNHPDWGGNYRTRILADCAGRSLVMNNDTDTFSVGNKVFPAWRVPKRNLRPNVPVAQLDRASAF